jgi:phosphate starvation-inducible PhoH-like protein
MRTKRAEKKSAKTDNESFIEWDGYKPKQIKLNDISLSEHQKQFKTKINTNIITFCTGPAGTSKTFTACVTAIEMLNKGIIDRIIFTKPIEESGTKLGILPGTLEEKIDPYLASYYETFRKIISVRDFEHLLKSKIIEFKPTTFMRGVSFDNTLMLCDEGQNYDSRELMLFITRMGKNSKIIICGDISQHDIKANKVGLLHIIEMLQNIEQIEFHTFDSKDIVRHPLLVEITERYEEYKKLHKLGEMK